MASKFFFILVSLITGFVSFALYFKLFLRIFDPASSDLGTAVPPAAEDAPTTTRPPSAQPTDLTLRFQEDGTFHIAIFEDLHYGEAEDKPWGAVQDANSSRVMETIISTEKPQLAVLNGDLITGENTYLENSTAYFDQIVQPLVKHSLPWASTYGNHDSDFNLSRSALYDKEKDYSLSLTLPVPFDEEAGITNYYLPIYPSDSSSNVPALILWFLDSRGGRKFHTSGTTADSGIPSVVDERVITWFRETSTRIMANYNTIIPSLAFFHIPPSSMLNLQNQGVDPESEPGINDDVPLDAQKGDEAFVSAITTTPGLLGTFSGHDHGNDWCYRWNGKRVHLGLSNMGLFHCFGRHTGYGGYGAWMRGSRQILLREDSLLQYIETWIRLEDQTVSGNVMLNETYGSDKYPIVDH